MKNNSLLPKAGDKLALVQDRTGAWFLADPTPIKEISIGDLIITKDWQVFGVSGTFREDNKNYYTLMCLCCGNLIDATKKAIVNDARKVYCLYQDTPLVQLSILQGILKAIVHEE